MKLTVKSKKAKTREAYSLILDKPEGFTFYPGQYLDIELPIKNRDKRGRVRAYTIASSPTEDFLMITTKIGISDFKKHLQHIKAGDSVAVTHPAGTFTLDEDEGAVMLAGGIGITPFRSMIKYLLDQKLTTPITLIYSNSDDNFLFKDELDKWQTDLPNLSLHYVNTKNDGRINKDKLQQILNHGSLIKDPIFYLAGSWSFVDDMEGILLDLGVYEVNIRYDRFDGY